MDTTMGSGGSRQGRFDLEAAARTPLDRRIVVGDCVSQGWRLTADNYGLFLGTTLVVLALELAMSFIPLLGGIAQMILGGVLQGGVTWVYLQRRRGQPASVGDAFIGFQRNFVELMAGGIVPGMFAGLCMLPAILVGAATFFLVTLHNEPNVGLIIATVGLMLVGLVPAIYLGVCWCFTLALVVDKQIGFWDAMRLSRRVVHAQWGTVFVLYLVAGLIGAMGVFGLVIGLLFTLPITPAITITGYEQLFGEPAQAASGQVT
jgi:uncharacterized membrane protein